ncbi:MAG: DEAD/DEAH box helicase [Microthrixaceae bacterium]|nr:DEAD/DEAH box helicase [Microthrixaceae bacterium]
MADNHPSDDQFLVSVVAHAHGEASPSDLSSLEADTQRWTRTLVHLLDDTEESLDRLRSAANPDDLHQIITDLDGEHRRLLAAYARLTGDVSVLEVDVTQAGLGHPTVALLQLSWEPGKVVAWAAGPTVGAVGADRVSELLVQAGASATGWSKHPSVRLSDGTSADALSISAGEILGWLVALGAEEPGPLVGPSALWLGQVAVWAVDLASRGAMVPLLRQRRRNRNATDPNLSSFSVRWTPALIDPDRFAQLADAMPGASTAVSPSTDGREVVKSALTGMIDAVCRAAAAMIDVPAPPPEVRNSRDTAETFLAKLDGTHFDAPSQAGNELVGRLDRWARPIISGNPGRLVVQLDPPDSSNAWHLIVLAADADEQLVSVEVALVNAGSQRREIEDQLLRLERMLPALLRPGSNRRGEVMLSQDEAWELMSVTGPELSAAGYDVRVPALTTRKATPSLRLTSEGAASTVVGANQLANVRWSAVFDDVELTAADIARLAKEARPLVRSGGRWVALDHADLNAAAAALAERANTTQLTGAEMLRHALGLEGSQLAGGMSMAGSSWAADLLASASAVAAEPVVTPDGFDGDLRSYQAEALGWLGFLDGAGLGGCLALDMGLGKTPTMLAHLMATAGDGPALVIAPPAVVGNWASEAAKFTPKLKVVVHHGASRASVDEIASEAATADVVITTYGTAVRDIAAIEKIRWDRLVLDEAQAIKNPANDTSQQLRRIDARVRVALTGTPIENGLGDLWAILDFTNPGLVGPRPQFIAQMSGGGTSARAQGEDALRALNGILVFRRTKAEPAIAAELPDRVDTLDHCSMTPEQIGLYQAVLDRLITHSSEDADPRKGEVLAAITALKQICNHPAAYQADDRPLAGRSGKLARLEEIVHSVFAADEKILIFTHFAEWGVKMADHLTGLTGHKVECYHGGLSRGVRDDMIAAFQKQEGAGALVLSLKAGGTGLNLTAASHVVLYDRWWNPAVEDQARDRAWRIGQTKTVICHRLVCPGTVDEKVEEVVNDKRRIADLVLPKSSSLADLDAEQLRTALGIRPDAILTEDAAELTHNDMAAEAAAEANASIEQLGAIA